MGLLNLSAPRKGRPSNIIETNLHVKRALTNLDKLYQLRRINLTQMQNALHFKRLAIAVYPSIGGPGIANDCTRQHRSNNIENETIFPLWKKLISCIELKCGRYICDILTKSLIDDAEIPELFDDQNVMMPLIKQFCLALDVVGVVLAENYTIPELNT